MKQQHAGLQRMAGTCCSHVIIPWRPKRQRFNQMVTCWAERIAMWKETGRGVGGGRGTGHNNSKATSWSETINISGSRH